MVVVNRKRAPRHLTIKVLILGDTQVGKSATIVRFLTHRFIGKYCSIKDWLFKQPIAYDKEKNLTTSVEFLELTCSNEGRYNHERSTNCNTDPNSNHDTTIVNSLKDKILWADAYIVLYAINDRDSFERAIFYLEAIHRHLNLSGSNGKQSIGRYNHSSSSTSMAAQHQQKRPILLLANKSDLECGRQVSGDEGHSLASLYQCLFSEISAAESHLGICNTIKALLTQANRLPTNTNEIKISTKLNHNLHNRYDSIKTSFRRASTAIVSTKTFVNHSRKNAKRAALTLSSNNDEQKTEFVAQTDKNGVDCDESTWQDHFGLTLSTQQRLMDGSCDVGKKNAMKKRSLFRSKETKTTIAETTASRSTTSPETMDEQISYTPSTVSSSNLGSFDDGIDDDDLNNNHHNDRVQKRKNKSSSRQSIYDAIFRRMTSKSTSTGSKTTQQSKNHRLESPIYNQTNNKEAYVKHHGSYHYHSADEKTLIPMKCHNRLLSYPHTCNHVVESGPTYSQTPPTRSKSYSSPCPLALSLSPNNLDSATTSNSNIVSMDTSNSVNYYQDDRYVERSLSRGCSSSSRSTDGSSSRSNVSRLLSMMFNRPASALGASYGQQDISNQSWPMASAICSYKHSESSSKTSAFSNQQNILINFDSNTDQSNQLHMYNVSHQLNFHQASCASEVPTTLDRKNRRWYRLIGGH